MAENATIREVKTDRLNILHHTLDLPPEERYEIETERTEWQKKRLKKLETHKLDLTKFTIGPI